MSDSADFSGLTNEQLRASVRPFTTDLQTISIQSNNRLSIRGSALWQSNDGEPVQILFNNSCYLQHKEQPYSRVLNITETSTVLDLGWLKDSVSFVLIKNMAPAPKSNLFKREDVNNVLKVSFGAGSGLLVRPGMSVWLEPEDINSLEIVSLGGETGCRLFIFSE